jgi:hypothetical protein
MSRPPPQKADGDAGGRKVQGVERRAWVRYPRRLQALWQLFGSSRGGENWSATLQDVSQAGLALVLDRAISPATVLSVRLQPATGMTNRPMLVRVRHCTALVDGRWLVGCSFMVKLSDDDLQELAADPAASQAAPPTPGS